MDAGTVSFHRRCMKVSFLSLAVCTTSTSSSLLLLLDYHQSPHKPFAGSHVSPSVRLYASNRPVDERFIIDPSKIFRHHPAVLRYSTNFSIRTMMSDGDRGIGHEQEDHQTASTVEQYLLDCKDHILSRNKSTKVVVTEKERKTMIRTLLGKGKWSKSEFKAKLQSYRTEQQWEKTREFVLGHQAEFEKIAKVTLDEETSRYFQQAISNYEQYEKQPLKLFTAMARGRIYQGKFDRLLDQVGKLEWKQIYDCIREEPEEITLLKDFSEHYLVNHGCNVEALAHTKELVTAALEKTFAKAVPQPSDGGKASGVQGEVNLVTYLQDIVLEDLSRREPTADFALLTSVMFMTQRKGRNINFDKTPYIVQIPPEVDLTGQTSELDALIVEFVSSDQLQIRQLWEAKATLHPITIGDALRKKGQTLQYFQHKSTETTNDNNNTIVQIKGDSYSIVSNGPTPQFGIFGKQLLNPSAGLTRMESAFGEWFLEHHVHAVEEALRTGTVTISQNAMVQELDRLLDLTRQYQTTMVIGSELPDTTIGK